MEEYTLQDISNYVEKSPNIIEEWFEELKNRLNHTVEIENDEGIYDEEDLKIIHFIAEQREERISYDEIFNKINSLFTIRTKADLPEPDTTFMFDKSTQGLGKDPETLFYEIAQDNEVIQMFKYHSLRVMFLSSMLAKRMDCYDEDLRVASLLHDIGKVGIAKSILLKPGKLSDLEFTIIQSHSHVGNVIVRKHLGLTRAAKFIRDHHERWDGTGYPRRLLGDEATIQGRIIAICDAFDTMTIDRRNYQKETLSYEDALKELQSCAWAQFDGNLVNAFIGMMEEGVKIPDYMLQEL
ncbi:HDIG domain-containing protein [Halobacillus dabanensis]|uniref:HDIG domain-containing protein n=1 Tax=Halobacillus dabanensis TaxID=240302 RepID=A0A1I3WBY6_HALDA|nr:HD domain-containing phosphohydrolase [Halobacillus dabanensis]SFK05015.1 HDIG domain-containing protein [Halobacillus dabanensis]